MRTGLVSLGWRELWSATLCFGLATAGWDVLCIYMLDGHMVRSDMGAVYLLPTLGLHQYFDSGPAT